MGYYAPLSRVRNEFKSRMFRFRLLTKACSATYWKEVCSWYSFHNGVGQGDRIALQAGPVGFNSLSLHLWSITPIGRETSLRNWVL